jgi:hypothetical protein
MRDPIGAGWRLEPAAVIGAAEGAEAVFAPDGAHIRTVGRSGGGPGEYRNANGLRWLTADTLV